jgi:hypothetical protein
MPIPRSSPGITDGEVPRPSPHAPADSRMPDDSALDSDGNMHSPTNLWPPAKEDPSKPFKSLR